MSDQGPQEILRRIQAEYMTIDAESIATFREVLCETEAGQDVLTWLLSVLGFFSTSDSTAEEALAMNYAKLILAKCGIWHAERMRMITKQLTELPAVVPEYTRRQE